MRPVTTLVTITTGGVVQRLTTDTSLSVNAVFIKPWSANSNGSIYVGTSDMVVATGVGMIVDLATSDASFSLPQTQNGLNQIHPADFYVSGTNTGDKILVTFWVA